MDKTIFWSNVEKLTMPFFINNIKHFDVCLSENPNWRPVDPKNHPKEGMYMTLRYGTNGLRTMINEWADGCWKASTRDGSYTILYRDFTDEEKEYLSEKHN